MTTKVGDELTFENCQVDVEVFSPFSKLIYRVVHFDQESFGYCPRIRGVVVASCKHYGVWADAKNWGLRITKVPDVKCPDLPMKPADAPAPIGWVDGPPEPPARNKPGHCRHGYLTCSVCDYDRQYYAKETNLMYRGKNDG